MLGPAPGWGLLVSIIDELKEALVYEPETGHFYWTKRLKKNPEVRRRADCTAGEYRIIKYGGISYAAHRVAWAFEKGEWPQYEIDHKNQQKDDNRIDNLRDVPHAVNMSNQKPRRRKYGRPPMKERTRQDLWKS